MSEITYKTSTELLKALAPLSAKERAALLENPQNRALVQSTGSNVQIISGKLSKGNSFEEQFKNVQVGLLKRLSPKTGKTNGVGALGGLSERTAPTVFATLSVAEKKALMATKDDIILKDNIPTLTNDLNIIRKNNYLREVTEELNDLGITNSSIYDSLKQATYIPMPIKDDNFIINIWRGTGMVFAVNPCCHIAHVKPEELKTLVRESKKNTSKKVGAEAAGYEAVSLFNALGRFGKTGGTYTSEDGRDMTYDYRYPHEYLTLWVEVSNLLKNDEQKMLNLIKELQEKNAHQISLKKVAENMRLGSDWAQTIGQILNISPQSVNKMEITAQKIFSEKKQKMIIQQHMAIKTH